MLHDPLDNQNSGVRDWKNQIMGRFLKLAFRHLYYSFFFYTDVKSRIAHFDDIGLFKFCSLIMKRIEPLCFFIWRTGFSVCSWSPGVPQRCLRSSVLGGRTREGAEGLVGISAGSCNSPPPPSSPRAAPVFLLYRLEFQEGYQGWGRG